MSVVEARSGRAVVGAPRRPRTAARRAWALGLTVAAVVAMVVTTALDVRSSGSLATSDLTWSLSWLSYVVVGALISHRRPDLGIGIVLVLSGATVEIAGVLTALAQVIPADQGRDVAWLAWWATLVYGGYFLLVGVILLLQLPEGRLPGGRTRLLLWTGLGAWSVWLVASVVEPGPLDTVAVANPLGWSAAATGTRVVSQAAAVVLTAVALLCCGRLLRQWRLAPTMRRQALAFLALGSLTTLALFGIAIAAPHTGVHFPAWVAASGGLLVVSALPVSVGLAVLRTRLLDIELVLRRTLTYGAMTLVVVAVYAATVLLVGRTTSRGAGLSASLLVVAVAAVGLSPLREQAQRRVDRLLYGRRADPYGVLLELDAAVAQARTPAQVLPAVTSTIADALRLPYVAVSTPEGQVVGHGEPADVARELPLLHHGRQVGSLLLAARSPGERFSGLDDKLLSDVADHAGSAVAAVALAEEAQRSRQQLVRALEDDRRRIRRDLHDHLGPVLSGIALQLDALCRQVESGGPAAELIGVIRAEVTDAVVDVRRLVHGLRPPVLDELGLLEAVRHHGDLLSEQLAVTVVADSLPPLPAAVEVAAYRIVTEALTNTLRHAAATSARVRLTHDERRLVVEVSDDGYGIDLEAEPGVGLTSMRERAAELGGVLAVNPTHPGTLVRAELPA